MRILIVRLSSMGDVIHALPAVAALRQVLPDAYIGWSIERRWTPLLVADETPLVGPRSPERPLVDAVHVVNTLAWRRAPFSNQTWAEMRHAFRDLRAQHYDVAIDFQGLLKSALVARFSGATMRIGFAQPREKAASMFYTSPVLTGAVHVIDQNRSLVSTFVRGQNQSEIGNQKSEMPLRPFASFAVDCFPSDSSAESSLLSRFSAVDQTTRFAILNPGAGWGAKQWPAARYGEVARALRDDGIVSLVNYGPREEPLAREVEQASGGVAQPIVCTLSELIALTRRAALFIGGDTGPMHLANALGVPVVALFGPTDPARTGPYPPSQSEIRNQKSEMPGWPTLAGFARVGNTLRHPSSRTDHRHRPDPDPGLLQISVDDVISAARTLLSGARTPDAGSPTRVPHPDRFWKGGNK